MDSPYVSKMRWEHEQQLARLATALAEAEERARTAEASKAAAVLAERDRHKAEVSKLRSERNAFADVSALGAVADRLDEDNAATDAAIVRAGAVEIGRHRALLGSDAAERIALVATLAERWRSADVAERFQTSGISVTCVCKTEIVVLDTDAPMDIAAAIRSGQG